MGSHRVRHPGAAECQRGVRRWNFYVAVSSAVTCYCFQKSNSMKWRQEWLEENKAFILFIFFLLPCAVCIWPSFFLLCKTFCLFALSRQAESNMGPMSMSYSPASTQDPGGQGQGAAPWREGPYLRLLAQATSLCATHFLNCSSVWQIGLFFQLLVPLSFILIPYEPK